MGGKSQGGEIEVVPNSGKGSTKAHSVWSLVNQALGERPGEIFRTTAAKGREKMTGL